MPPQYTFQSNSQSSNSQSSTTPLSANTSSSPPEGSASDPDATDTTVPRRGTPTKGNKAGLVVTDLLKLRISLDQAKTSEAACQVLAENIANMFDCSNVFVSLFQGRSLRLYGQECEETFPFDKDNIVSAQREVTNDKPVCGWPETNNWSPSVVHKSLTHEHCPTTVSFLVVDRDNRAVGVVTLAGSKSTCSAATEKIKHVFELVVPQIQLQQKASRTTWQRAWSYILKNSSVRLKWAVVVALSMIFFFVRIPHRIQCGMEVKPVTRRYVSAPFDSVLKSSKVRAGEFVQAKDALAQLDQDEVMLQRSSVEAEKEKFRKQKSSALAKGETLAMQQAQLEFKRLSFKNNMLQQRSENLEISSPISGVVLKNELEDAEGAPLTQGQVLFEIAPLDQMIFTLYISQQDVAYVNEGMKVQISVDAARSTFAGTICRIRPQAVLFENESVFIAEVEFDNKQGVVRPGMRGYATIIGEHQSVGWILFRKPYNYFKRLSGF